MDIGGGELIVIILVILLLFGSKKIPELARGLGKGINEFKRATEEIKREITAEGEQLTRAVEDIKSDGTREIRELKNSVSTSFEEMPKESLEEPVQELVQPPVAVDINTTKKEAGTNNNIPEDWDGSGI